MIKFGEVPVQNQRRIFNIKQNKVAHEDNLFLAINDLTDRDDTFLSVVDGAVYTRTSDYRTKLNFEFHVSNDATQIDRAVYNTFMLLGDVGGFSGVLLSFGATILGFLNFQNPENFLASHLYRTRETASSQILKPGGQTALKEYFQSALPFCCRRSKTDKYFAQARDLSREEMDIVALLRQLRFFNAAIHLLLGPHKVAKLKDQTHMLHLDDPTGEIPKEPAEINIEMNVAGSQLPLRRQDLTQQYSDDLKSASSMTKLSS